MLATGADAVVIALRDGGDSILEGLGLPAWVHTGLSGTWEEALALAAIALAEPGGSADRRVPGVRGQPRRARVRRDRDPRRRLTWATAAPRRSTRAGG